MALREIFGARSERPPPESRSDGTIPPDPGPVELIHPFYLDTDMSMAFAAAISGGVALQSEDLQRDSHESQAVKKIQGNLRAFDLVGVAAGRESTQADAAETQSRFVRQHTEASIFIALHDELQRTDQIRGLDMEKLRPGELLSLTLGPAVAPLRRVVDQIIRFFEVAAPMMGMDLEDSEQPDDGARMTRQRRRQAEREAAKGIETDPAENESVELQQIVSMFRAIQEDLDQSGMVDVVIHREDEPSVVLTLDKRFASDQVLELLHTSKFTVIGKVTEIWPTEDDVVNLYRRSVMSLVPALTQMSAWGMIGLLAALAAGIDVGELRASALAAAGVADEEEDTDGVDGDEVLLGDVTALTPMVTGPAIQILPLAICALAHPAGCLLIRFASTAAIASSTCAELLQRLTSRPERFHRRLPDDRQGDLHLRRWASTADRRRPRLPHPLRIAFPFPTETPKRVEQPSNPNRRAQSHCRAPGAAVAPGAGGREPHNPSIVSPYVPVNGWPLATHWPFDTPPPAAPAASSAAGRLGFATLAMSTPLRPSPLTPPPPLPGRGSFVIRCSYPTRLKKSSRWIEALRARSGSR